MQCPICKEVELHISERQGVEIDYCPQCRGVWLDRGELDKLIERSVQREYSTPRPEQSYDQRHGQHYERRRDYEDDRADRYGKRRKKGGWLGEILDFD